MPHPDADVPTFVVGGLSTVFLRHFAGVLTPADIETFHSLAASYNTRQALRHQGVVEAERRPHSGPSSNGHHRSFITFRTRAKGEELGRRANNVEWNGRVIISSCGGGGTATKQQWRWRDLAPDFVDECFKREMAHYAAHPTHSVNSMGAAGLSDLTVPLPPHLASPLFGLYTSNSPENATLAECRDFFDQAKHQLYGGRYPGSHIKLWVEHGEHALAKRGIAHTWTWEKMSKDCRRLHASEYQQADVASAPDLPPLAPAARSDHNAPQHGPMFAPPVQPAASGASQAAYTPIPVPMPSYPSPAPSMILAQQQHQTEAYSPMQPGLGPFVPRPQAAFVGAPAQATVWRQQTGAQMQPPPSQQIESPAPPEDDSASSAAKVGGIINRARLAMLQAALNERGGGMTSPAEPVERQDVADEKKLGEETTGIAWGARTSQAASAEATDAEQQHQATQSQEEQPAAPAAESAPAASPSNSPPRTLSVKGLASSALLKGSPPPKPASPLPSAASMAVGQTQYETPDQGLVDCAAHERR
ncbi:hypothetical protein Rt10032_c21g6434 [Rhodotorula toruloides]|uniref:Uncharacterized protein n=1 Tax=Rhodotorula toruloides TaxID=5286 RepID=A0A511KPX2_RHOTO|nr:hypothetical protein Rt10032_c21g6434 [Rhodotorula toruloides]